MSTESSTDITFSNRSNSTTEKTNNPSLEVPTTRSKDNSHVKPGKLDLENFIPETGDFNTFLEDENSTANPGNGKGNGNLDSRLEHFTVLNKYNIAISSFFIVSILQIFIQVFLFILSIYQLEPSPAYKLVSFRLI